MAMNGVFFRVDSGSHIGSGHLRRCLSFADALHEVGFSVSFITKDHFGSAIEEIPEYISIHVIPGGLKKGQEVEKDNYSQWLGGSWEDDLRSTNAVLSQYSEAGLVVIDHYSLGLSYEKGLRCAKLFVIDDLSGRPHCCDYFLDQNLPSSMRTHRLLRRNASTRTYLGPRYSLQDKSFSTLRARIDPDTIGDKAIEKILVFFGGGDICNSTINLARALNGDMLGKYEFTFVLDQRHGTFPEMTKFVSSNPQRCSLISFTSTFSELMMEHDFFIGAGGSTSWERATLGIPSAVISMAENQVGICESLGREGLAHYLGAAESVTKSDWLNLFSDILSDRYLVKTMALKGFDLTDGTGAMKIARDLRKAL
ncbi:UDP-2,4-diacetamido-2,4,6-trideoxy-beta-L-altropyranose hydrolase [Pseudohalioglobus lutimaris]|uniref:UDP-2,4-diacetamido-2,4, 6-trideoxy-beta-L-altropyranose hydrolase n=1 Tax=Pseudohalioglobus lutimaris TaxID=1737061 RepID=A0A2N5X6Y3_9GAMM|nr:UDP-2,4-diacetamido-2,4,6-trideoxy-beta-L-altropyranose hydrolase [Pseudohalioglobus lutimaris]PLW70249.1 UDP-2,4-diacetamido-2,4,6-trideoxy-beta-L-altropyranose hydrolase [Pseudohalioglobus lutimaris]